MSADALGYPAPERVSPLGIMLQEPNVDVEVTTAWRGDSFRQDLGDAGRPLCYRKCVVDAWELREGDMVYCTPSEKGSPMEFAYVEGLFADKDEDNEEIKQAYVRWFYVASQVKRNAKKDCHCRELFLSNTWDQWPVEGIEGCVYCSSHACLPAFTESISVLGGSTLSSTRRPAMRTRTRCSAIILTSAGMVSTSRSRQ